MSRIEGSEVICRHASQMCLVTVHAGSDQGAEESMGVESSVAPGFDLLGGFAVCALTLREFRELARDSSSPRGVAFLLFTIWEVNMALEEKELA